jgi:hypothetical protein
MTPASQKAFDFDEWAALARADSDAFERRRQELIAAVIAAAPAEHQQRLRGLQFRIDLERQRSGTPLGAAIRLNAMMWSSFSDLRTALESFHTDTAPAPKGPGATLLPFPQRP